MDLTALAGILHASVFYQIASILLLAGVFGFIGFKLHQPLIVAFIATGIVTGPDFLGIVAAHSAPIELLATLGITLLLFTVGLKLDLSLIRTLGAVSLATGLGQMTFTSLTGFLVCFYFGFGMLPSIYVAIALMFSSTIIIVKLLSDKNEIDSLHGRISLGFLIVEDIVVVLCMAFLSAFGVASANGTVPAELIAMVFLKGAALIGFVALFISKIATSLIKPISRSPELMAVFAVGWAAAFAATVEALGFSIELGGLLAGISLASTPFRDIILSRLSGLRDFMLLFFFIDLGARIDIDILGNKLVPALVLSVLTLLGKPFILMIVMGLMGYKKRTSFLTSLSVAQISEFSLVFIGLGVALGHVDNEMLGLVTLVALITIATSTYMISYSHHLYALIEPFLGIFERQHAHGEHGKGAAGQEKTYDAIVFGLGRYGTEITRHLLDRDMHILGLDFDPDAVRHAKKTGQHKNFDTAYGDVSDPYDALPLSLNEVKWVICAVPHYRGTLQDSDPRLALLEALKIRGFKGKTAIISHNREESEVLKKRGVDLILTPFSDAAQQAVDGILAG